MNTCKVSSYDLKYLDFLSDCMYDVRLRTLDFAIFICNPSHAAPISSITEGMKGLLSVQYASVDWVTVMLNI